MAPGCQSALFSQEISSPVADKQLDESKVYRKQIQKMV